ncbi:MAG: tRNA preQ1(34) S-adenosylmethionine ribosyltransferase-isomerase QueA [Candidatus Dormibacteraeota bacterium]|uniref:S-adenosylmethionine:tRNA ribosyltransferase-isomerase n=1 Tax=Candidatus Amunia macphersoniae TaxID=3127014 RepID=A0A934KQW5_9BACT|nr:tRNA preQ1(34) S-adenosylmethionine ribosyltransferase-isomerase QueA [Candidatus Dormibacteraeota bacterium]
MGAVTNELEDRALALSTEQFDYSLPADRIAQVPLEPRDSSKLLLMDGDGTLHDRVFTDLPTLLRAGDLLVANDTTVRAARLRGRRDDGGLAEVLLLQRLDAGRFTALVRPGRRLHAGASIQAAHGLRITVAGPAAGHRGARVVSLEADADLELAIAAAGEPPLPPYIREPLKDSGRYQTVYATGEPASSAAPTAGLHFTARVRDALRERGVGWATLQLDVGLGTFAPITATDISSHRMHAEHCTLPSDTAVRIDETHSRGGRVIAIGTTVVRTLESHVDSGGRLCPGGLSTELFITPGHRFSVVDGLLTNFHQPRSSLLVLLAAFTGMRGWRSAYQHALTNNYRFLSFGDCMLCWRNSDAAA